MITLTLTREAPVKGAIFGLMQGLSRLLHTLEGVGTSFPSGKYLCKPHGWEPGNPYKYQYTRVWEITGIPKRGAMLFHIGNFIKNTRGCVLPGLGRNPATPMVTDSAKAIEIMREEIGQNSFWLIVK
jgi:hypothetical protein